MPLLQLGARRPGRPVCSTYVQAQAAAAPAAPPAPATGLRRLGNSDLQVSKLCYGTMTFGSQNTEAEAHKLLSIAVDGGINFLDTAEMYPAPPSREKQGLTSTYIGTWLKQQRREDIVIATKVAGRSAAMTWVTANRTDPPGKEEENVLNAKNIRLGLEGELRRLQTDYVDLLQLHWPDRYLPNFGRYQYNPEDEWQATPFEEQVEAVGRLIQEGKVRAWGLSNESTYGVTRHCTAADQLGMPRPVTIQNSYSLLHRQFESELAEACSPSNFNIGLLPWSTLAGGALTGKYLHNQKPPGARMTAFPERYGRWLSSQAALATEDYCQLAKQAGITPAQLAYAFCASRWFIPSTIIGARTPEQLHENLKAADIVLEDDLLESIKDVYLRCRDPSLTD